MVAMRSPKAAIAHSMKMRDLINSNSADHSLGDKAPVGASRHLCRRGSLSFKQRGRRAGASYSPTEIGQGCGWGGQQQGSSTRSNLLAVHRCTQTPVSRGVLPPPCWFSVCPASSAFLVCKPTQFPSFLSCRRLSHESELLGSDPSLTIILAKATEET